MTFNPTKKKQPKILVSASPSGYTVCSSTSAILRKGAKWSVCLLSSFPAVSEPPGRKHCSMENKRECELSVFRAVPETRMNVTLRQVSSSETVLHPSNKSKEAYLEGRNRNSALQQAKKRAFQQTNCVNAKADIASRMFVRKWH